MKIVFYGSTNLALPVLEALRAEHEIVAVVTTPDAKAGRKQEEQETPVSLLAKDLKLPLFKPENLKGNAEFLNQLKDLSPELGVVVAYGRILPDEFINLPQHKTINAHPSMLPKYRGPSPMRTALLNGDEYTGVSFILLDDQMDHGPLLAQQVVKIEEYDNDFMLTDKLGKISAGMVNDVIKAYTSGAITPLPQDDAHATKTLIVEKKDGKVDWQKTSKEIYNQFRAFYPWPGIWTTWNGKNLKITDCVTTEAAENYGSTLLRPGFEGQADNYGTVLSDGSVVCGGGTILKIKSLQLEGKTETDIKSFLNGYKEFVGSRLG